MARLFGTDGIRGVANQPPMTVETAVALGRALARYCRELDKRDIGNRPCVVVGRDTRLSGPMLESAVAAGLCSAGADVLRVGVVPTPAIAFLARQSGAAAGVVISASHNPYYDNGIKVFSGQGFKLSDEEEERLEDLMTELGAGVGEVRESAAGGADAGSKTKGAGAAVGTVSDLADAADRYMAFCLGTFPGSDLAGMRLVLDCAHGATYKVAPAVFRALGAEVEVLNDQPDGVNINADCGSEHPDELQRRVRELGADAGLAFDGDGDRLIAVDELGRLVTGDQLLAVCARFYKEQGWLTNDLVVSTVMSNLGLRRALVQMGLQHATSLVGDRYVLQVMQEKGAVLGGEDSGHLVFLRHHTTGDGLVAALQLLGAMRYYREPLSSLAAIMTPLPQRTVNVEVRHRPPLEEVDGLGAVLAEAEQALGEEGRVLVRYSGTQPICRIMVEGPTVELTETWAERLAQVVRTAIGVG